MTRLAWAQEVPGSNPGAPTKTLSFQFTLVCRGLRRRRDLGPFRCRGHEMAFDEDQAGRESPAPVLNLALTPYRNNAII